jgi:Spy/CpxP family protein refolding chaperone
MKKPLKAVACAIALSIPLAAAAQQAAASTPANASAADPARISKLRDQARTDRKALVAKNLPLTEAEAKAFWPVYEKCRQSLDASHSKVNRAMTDYVSAGDKMTDANAKRILGEVLAGEAAEAKARNACFSSVSKVLPGIKAARYFQIETKIAALFRFDAAVAIPLVD